MRLLIKVIQLLLTILIVFSIPSLLILNANEKKMIYDQAHMRAQTIYEMIVITRQWVAERRDEVEPVPAVATKRLSQYAKEMASFSIHITSDKLVNEENRATDYELKAMNSLKNSKAKEIDEIIEDENGRKFYTYSAPLHINSSCMGCHGYQEYKIGDMRGLISISFALDEFEQTFAKNTRLSATIVLSLFVIIFAILLISLYFMIIKHLSTLHNATTSLTKGRRIATQIKTNDELEMLSKAFDEMSFQIVNNEDILRSKLDEVSMKYKNLVQDLENKNEALDAINKLKSNLLDSIAHEIRTPLTKILSYSELLQDERVLSQKDTREKVTANLKDNTKVIKQLFNDIITLSRLEHSQHQYHTLDINIVPLISEIVESMELDIANKSIKISKDIEEAIISIDVETFSTAISNIISNAIKYSKNGGLVEIVGRITDNQYSISVKDYGIGIPKEAISHITERFFRAENAKRGFPGTGLGLSIVQRIVADHNGKVEISSKENEWTLISIIIPFMENVNNDKDL